MAGERRRSKKPSGTKAESLLETSTFFVDRCLGKGVVVALRESGLKVEAHGDHFDDDADDDLWISVVGGHGWIVFTKDKAIRRRSVELEAVVAGNVRMFALSSGNMTGDEMARVFVDNRLKIARIIKDTPPPFIARVSRSGVKLVYPARSDP